MIISALENLIPITELYRNREEKEHFIATKPQLESFVINQLSQMEFFFNSHQVHLCNLTCSVQI